MPNFQKSKGFQLRSGNKGGAPFKMMGSSPAKGIFDSLGGLLGGKKEGATGTDINQFAKKDDATDLGAKSRVITPTTKAKEIAKPKAKGWAEKKADNKAEKKVNKGTRKDFKAGNKEEIAELKGSGADRKTVRAAKKENRQEQRDLRKSHKDDSKANKKDYKSGDDYKAHKKQQRQEIGKGLEDFGNALGQSSYAGGSGSIGSNLAGIEQQRESQKSQDILDQTRSLNNAQKISDFEKGLTEENKLETSRTTATADGKTPELASTSTAAKVHAANKPV